MLPNFVDKVTAYVLLRFREMKLPRGSYPKLAEAIGVKQQTVRRWHLGERGIESYQNAKDLALALGWKMSEVALGVGDEDAAVMFMLQERMPNAFQIIKVALEAGGKQEETLLKAIQLAGTMNQD